MHASYVQQVSFDVYIKYSAWKINDKLSYFVLIYIHFGNISLIFENKLPVSFRSRILKTVNTFALTRTTRDCVRFLHDLKFRSVVFNYCLQSQNLSDRIIKILWHIIVSNRINTRLWWTFVHDNGFRALWFFSPTLMGLQTVSNNNRTLTSDLLRRKSRRVFLVSGPVTAGFTNLFTQTFPLASAIDLAQKV